MLTQEQRLFLSRSEAFQKQLAEDSYLNELIRKGPDRGEELCRMLDFLGASDMIGSLSVRPITPMDWILLWGLGNHYAGNFREISRADTDQLLWLLSRTNADIRKGIPSGTDRRCRNMAGRAGITYPEAAAHLLNRIRRSFMALEELPIENGEYTTPPIFDLHWLIRLCSVVAAAVLEPFTKVMKFPLSFCCAVFVNRYREQDRKIHPGQCGENAQRIVEYVESAGEEFLLKNRSEKDERQE